jgi:hypothetical protein
MPKVSAGFETLQFGLAERQGIAFVPTVISLKMHEAAGLALELQAA